MSRATHHALPALHTPGPPATSCVGRVCRIHSQKYDNFMPPSLLLHGPRAHAGEVGPQSLSVRASGDYSPNPSDPCPALRQTSGSGLHSPGSSTKLASIVSSLRLLLRPPSRLFYACRRKRPLNPEHLQDGRDVFQVPWKNRCSRAHTGSPQAFEKQHRNATPASVFSRDFYYNGAISASFAQSRRTDSPASSVQCEQLGNDPTILFFLPSRFDMIGEEPVLSSHAGRSQLSYYLTYC